MFRGAGTRAAVRGLALIAEVDPALPDAVQGDRRKLSQILLNLVGNAIKFSDAGAVTVRVRAGTQPDQLHFAVEDHGIGIEPARQQEVFEPSCRCATAAATTPAPASGWRCAAAWSRPWAVRSS